MTKGVGGNIQFKYLFIADWNLTLEGFASVNELTIYNNLGLVSFLSVQYYTLQKELLFLPDFSNILISVLQKGTVQEPLCSPFKTNDF